MSKTITSLKSAECLGGNRHAACPVTVQEYWWGGVIYRCACPCHD